MFSALRATSRAFHACSFSTSSVCKADLARLVLVGNLVREPDLRVTKTEKEYVVYTVATQNYPPPPADVNGERRPSTATFHKILSFQDGTNKYLRSLKKGSKVFVEANFELREPEAGADPTTPQGQRQILLRHESIRVLSYPKQQEIEEEHKE
ncbi:hypothetical protein K443DRAFT_672504 [Laccaria amethystina LaAM-08-1]|uniref:Single-stranded DNA-binding protein n=1 Tax=Laccaria amethystina LaAM-08-1 TaxID=1095629 RepID=A0A0C9X8G6_9AGAR|nr:hypothetical protein K443DRAFT_672504 [Laccaria amethystina LaAM-08-1]